MNILTRSEVEKICKQLFMEDCNIDEEISCIVYRIEMYDVDTDHLIDRHIDIEYSYGEYCEICEDTDLFQYICSLCDLPLLQEEQEIVIYEK